jgi:hypothetical protein
MSMAAGGAKKGPGAAAKFRMSRRQNADFSTLARLENLWVPAAEQIEDYTREAVELQETLRDITARLDGEAPGLATGTG